MPDPVSLTASAIATLAVQKFVESGAGEIAKKFTTEAIATMERLLKRIWAKLRGKPRVEEVKAATSRPRKSPQNRSIKLRRICKWQWMMTRSLPMKFG